MTPHLRAVLLVLAAVPACAGDVALPVEDDARPPPGTDAAPASPDAPPEPPPSGVQLQVVGNRLVRAADGTPMILRGANIIRWVWTLGAFDADVAVADGLTRPRATGGWGANAFLLWVDTDRVNDGTYLDYADAMADVAVANTAYVLLSWHAAHDEAHPSRIDDAGIAAMRALAERYREVPNVLYIVQAEPGNGSPDYRQLSWQELKPWEEATIDAIRGVHPDAIVGISGTAWSQSFDELLADPIDRPNLFVQPHLYRHGIDTLDGLFAARRVTDLAARMPVVIGEFGSEEWPADLIGRAEGAGIGWQGWNLSDIGGPVMLNSMDPDDRNAFGDEVHGAIP